MQIQAPHSDTIAITLYVNEFIAVSHLTPVSLKQTAGLAMSSSAVVQTALRH